MADVSDLAWHDCTGACSAGATVHPADWPWPPMVGVDLDEATGTHTVDDVRALAAMLLRAADQAEAGGGAA